MSVRLRSKGLVHTIETILPLCLITLWVISFVVVRCVDHYACELAWYWQALLTAVGPLFILLALAVLFSPLYVLIWIAGRAEARAYEDKQTAILEDLLQSKDSSVRQAAAEALQKIKGQEEEQ